jgi:hypothetical protein
VIPSLCSRHGANEAQHERNRRDSNAAGRYARR